MITKTIETGSGIAGFMRGTLGLAALGIASLETVAPANGQTSTPTTPAAAASAPAAPATPAAAAAPTPPPYGKKANKDFWSRLGEAELEQLATPCYVAPTPPPPGSPPPAPSRRIGDPPFDSPPFADQDWQLGGGPNVIGDPGALRDSPYPLMQAIYDGPDGQAWYNSRIQLYGWITESGNISTSRNTGPSQVSNYPEVYDERGNHVENDQDVLYIERMADENQTENVDWGFRIALLYGLDYRFMASKGYINDQNLFYKNKYSGFDTPMVYYNLYIPTIAQGENIIIGRIISLPDIEQQLAPNNLMASHSLVYSFDDYTTWGIWTSTKLDKNWLLQIGLADGVDIAPWAKDPGVQPTLSVMVQYIAPGGQDSFYVGMNSLNNGHFGFNNLQECIESYSHKFNDTVWTTFELQYMYQKGASTVPTSYVPFVDGFYPTKDGYVWAGGLLNYTCFRISPKAFFTVRNEWWDDPDGSRSGYSSPYYEGSVGITWWMNKLMVFRPELRFDHSFKANALESSSGPDNFSGAPEIMHGAYDNGLKNSQLTFMCDLTYHF
ncbi:MAG: outer membrane beta-barrel protein [Opitutaceae bacterium]